MENEQFKLFLAKASKWCAMRDRCIRDLRYKLKEWEVPEEMIVPLTERLINSEFIDDGRFAKSFVSAHLKMKGWGPSKIKSALFQKGISETLIHTALQEFEKEEWGNALTGAIAKAHRNGHHSKDYQAKQKLIRHLMAKGFAYDEIANKISTSNNDDD